MTLKAEISVGDILTIVSILISVIALLVSWHSAQQLKRKEYADKIRRGASSVVVKLQRWRELTLNFFEEIQPIITEADIELARNRKVSHVRDIFWQKLSGVWISLSQRIIDEQIETAYIDLYGFDPRIQTLYFEVINRLKAIDSSIHNQLLYATQSDILGLRSESSAFNGAQLGNKLRNTAYAISQECKRLMDEAIEPFSKEMIRLIEQADTQIVRRRFKITSVYDLYPVRLDELQRNLDQRIEANLVQMAQVMSAPFPLKEDPETSFPSRTSGYVTPMNLSINLMDDPHQDIYLGELARRASALKIFADYVTPMNSFISLRDDPHQDIYLGELTRRASALKILAQSIRQIEEKKEVARKALDELNKGSISEK